ncbi:MAG: (d)CMP kinase [Chloroflexi bacterium]|nr:(d)CMP kinase [Chloroflexota bacterium]MCI0648456.1 (d)CMP kinase [Chloroflexota bacterium]MCI0726637.1 (d)CMP kinase [Chloroflexota bacterium]
MSDEFKSKIQNLKSKIPNAIAIDGPAASGKTTIGRMLADYLNCLFLDTGSMYRATTLAALQNSVPIDDEPAVTTLTEQLDMDIIPVQNENDGRLYTVWLNGRDVTWELRAPAVDRHVSQVSAYKGVRQNLVQRQRSMAQRGRVVMVGRDIGTVVLPDAPVKLYIVASAEERARRRMLERRQRGLDVDHDQILADIIRRDRIDSSREHSPMRPAADALIIDTTGRSPEAVLREILALPAFQPAQARP